MLIEEIQIQIGSVDWREKAIEELTPSIIYYAKKFQSKDITFDDYLQELTFHLWNKLPKFDPTKKPTMKTWASRVLWNKCIDLDRVANKKKRSDRRKVCRVYD